MSKATTQTEEGHGRVTFRLPAPLLREIQELADRDRRSRNNMVALMLEEACKRERARQDEEEPEKETA